MRTTLAIILLGSLTSACDTVVCGEGTIERAGKCEPADNNVTNAECGPFTTLMGGKCVPDFDPTMCDPATTTPTVDPDTGVTTCVGTGGGGCDATFACPQPSDSSHQTICGQIYDLETGDKFRAADATGAPCTATTADGPCAMGVAAYDAYQFATDPQNAQKLSTGPVYIDDCGRYRVPDVATPTSPFVGLGFDDADQSKIGPTGVTNGVGISLSSKPGEATKDIDGWFAAPTTTAKWGMNGGPSLSTGYFVAIYFANKTGRALQAGVTPTHSGSTDAAHDFFFGDTDAKRTTIDSAASATGANGTALVTGAVATDTFAWSGTGGLPPECKYLALTEASLQGLVIVQEYRPVNNGTMTCTR